MYFTRGLAKRCKVNKHLDEHYGKIHNGLHDVHAWRNAVEGDNDYDEDADEWVEHEIRRMIITITNMMHEYNFDKEIVKALHPAIFSLGYATKAIEAYHKRADLKKLSWIFEELNRNPIVINKIQC